MGNIYTLNFFSNARSKEENCPIFWFSRLPPVRGFRDFVIMKETFLIKINFEHFFQVDPNAPGLITDLSRFYQMV